MPHAFVVEHAREFVARAVGSEQALSREQLIAELARDFDVSTEAMGFRLINLGILAA
jgi:Zn-dependent peptidase ImmA (M78 family)